LSLVDVLTIKDFTRIFQVLFMAKNYSMNNFSLCPKT
jgi:hypothetical protein